jgi:hypothetical protein
MLEQACRQRDRCDTLASDAAAGDRGALRHERDSALAMTRLLAALRLPDEGGRKPQLVGFAVSRHRRSLLHGRRWCGPGCVTSPRGEISLPMHWSRAAHLGAPGRPDTTVPYRSRRKKTAGLGLGPML